MKSKINSILLSVAIITLVASCSKTDSEFSEFKDTDVYNSQNNNSIMSYMSVISHMEDIGAVEVDIPSEYVYDLAKETYDWSIMRLFLDASGVYYEVYAWAFEPNDGFMMAENECHHIWYSNGDCKDDGKVCDVIIEGGKVKIICCDEAILDPQVVEMSLIQQGAEEVGIPAGFSHFFCQTVHQWSDFKRYLLGDTYYSLYTWDYENVDKMMTAATTCHHIYYENGDCKDKGTQCEVTIEDGEVVITHCPPPIA